MSPWEEKADFNGNFREGWFVSPTENTLKKKRMLNKGV
jgi:hypothetical protein